MTMFVSSIALSLGAFVYSVGRMFRVTYLAQQESYQVAGFWRHYVRKTVAYPEIIMWALAVVSVVLWELHAEAACWIAALAAFVVGVQTYVVWHRQKGSLKKPLVWTSRAKRLGTTFIVLTVVEVAVLYLFSFGGELFAGALGTVNMAIALVLTKPIEWSVQSGYKRKATARLRQLRQLNHLRVAGITGSFGKTSTKFILSAILGAKYEVLATPGSYNTPMGVCKVVNGDLAAHHEVFVCEMGARHRGDIKELVQMVEPTYSMITAVGPAHLETFGSLENIAHTKFDLARGTSPDGVVVVNGDNEYCVREAKTLDREVLFYGLNPAPHLNAYAKDIRMERGQTAFTLVLPGDGEVECKTKLLGKHNVLNVIGAALMARRMGLSLSEIEAGIARVEPVEHRLQLIDPGTGILVIDDAFNANPSGAEAALEVLGQFEGFRKWIVTPGMVELGGESETIHREFGRKMAAVCDNVVLIGKMNADSMREGLRDAGFPEDHIYVRTTLAEWMKESGNHWRQGDVILFENDFGDHLETLN